MSGSEDFSGFEVIRAAMEVEKNGHRFYAGMVEKAHTSLARDLFAMLAQDEVVHLRTLEKLASEYDEGAFWEGEEEFLPYLRRFNDREIFPSAEAVASALISEEGDIRALELAIVAEEKFAAYFHMAAKHALSSEGKKALPGWLKKKIVMLPSSKSARPRFLVAKREWVQNRRKGVTIKCCSLFYCSITLVKTMGFNPSLSDATHISSFPRMRG